MIRENGKILIIADDRNFSFGIRKMTEKVSSAELTIESCIFDQGAAAVKMYKPDVIILDGDRGSK